MEKFDVFVIGTGVAGTIIANKCAEKGLKTGITDNRTYGGTCALHGCTPKKVLVNAIHVMQSSQNLSGKGLENEPSINWKELIAFKNTIIDPIPSNKEDRFKTNNISTYHGKAVFSDKNQLRIGNELVEADKIVIATGATSRELTIPGAEHALSSDDFLELKELPKSILFIGGGYIAMEFAHIAARSGADVTILDMEETPLQQFEQDIVKHLVDVTKELGINMVMNTKVAEIKKEENNFVVTGDNDGNKITFTCDAVFNTSGRVPNIFDLNLKEADVLFSEDGIAVNEYMQSVSNSHVYAAGDNTDTEGLPLTPFATMEGHVAASNIIEGNNKKPDYKVRPTVVYTVPSLATVGVTEKEARENELSIQVNYKSVPEWFNAKHRGESTYAYKVIIDKESDLILGAHLIGTNAEETINLFALAIKTGIKAGDLKTIPFTFPSDASDIPGML